MKNLDIGENIGLGFNKAINNAWFFVAFFIFTFFATIAFMNSFGISSFSDTAFFIIAIIFYYIIFIGIYKISLGLLKNKKVDLKKTDDLPLVLNKFILALTMYFAIVFMGLIFFIVPGIIAMIKYQFVPFIILDEKDIGIRQAFRKSNSLASGVHWNLLWFLIISDLFNLAGFMFFGIGLIITIPSMIIAKAGIYKELIK
ncbi:MAG: hypothetical protein PHU74_00140 [Candidatus Pacebacteria bacterium]|nr:hypothetical protein [Candidatus Paceibacterota bacterium]